MPGKNLENAAKLLKEGKIPEAWEALFNNTSVGLNFRVPIWEKDIQPKHDNPNSKVPSGLDLALYLSPRKYHKNGAEVNAIFEFSLSNIGITSLSAFSGYCRHTNQ